MNKRFITGVLILACVSFIVRQSYGCTDSPIARIVNEYYQDVPVGTRVYFDGIGSSAEETGSYDPDNGSPYGGGNGIDKYYWKYGDDPNDPNWYDDGGEPSHVYDAAGIYEVALYVVDDDNDRSDYNDYCEVWVYKIDKVVKDGTTDEGPLYVVCPDDTVDLEAIPYPNVEYYPTDETIWDVNQQPEGADALLNPDSSSLTTTLSGMTEPGDYVIKARCGPNDPGDTIVVTTPPSTGYWLDFMPGFSCPPLPGETNQKARPDDCGNTLAVFCDNNVPCIPGGGGGGFTAFTWWYARAGTPVKGTRVGICVWIGGVNIFDCKTTFDKERFLQTRHVTQNDAEGIDGDGEGCDGYWCWRVQKFDCVNEVPVAGSPWWRRRTGGPGGNETHGWPCPGTGGTHLCYPN